MAVERAIPYGRFKFMVEWDGMDGSTVEAGFSEVSGLDATICVAEYRAGNSPVNTPIKIPGMTHYADVHLKRGVIGSLDLYQWFDEVSRGNVNLIRSVTISLLDESHNDVVYRWRLRNARPVALYGPRLEANHCAVAIEELVLAHEGLRID